MIKYVSISLSVIIFLIFGYTLLHDSLNAPSFDDYDATLSFIKRFYFEQHTFSEKLGMLFSRHNEHRIFLSRLTAVAYYYFFNELNFKHLVIFQNVFLFGTFGIFLSLMIKNNLPNPGAFLIAAVFILNLSFFQVSFYYWGGIQYYTVFFFSILSLCQLDKSVRAGGLNFISAVFFVLLGAFSFGNGFIALFLGGFMLLVQKKRSLFVIWTILSIVVLLILFVGVPQIDRPGREPFNIGWMVRLLFTFAGSFLFVNPTGQFWRYANIVVCAIAGIGVILYWVKLFFNGYAFKKPLLYCLLSLPMLTGIIISISRYDTKSAGGIASRYMFFTAIIPVMLLLILWDRKAIRKTYFEAIALTGVLLWGVGFYFNRAELRTTNADIADRIGKWQEDPTTRLIYYHEAAAYSRIMAWASEHKVLPEIRTAPGVEQKD